VNLSRLITLLSLNTTLSLVQDYSVVAGTLAITAAAVTTPITVTVAGHGVPLGNELHAVVTGVTGMVEANGLWILTPVDANTFSLSTLDAQGNVVDSAGSHTYTGGGTISYAFPIPDGRIMLGRRNYNKNMAGVSPRIVMVPTDGRKWDFDPYGGAGNIATLPPSQGNAETQAQKLEPQIATHYPTFEVYVSATGILLGAAEPDPDALDFDAVESLCDILTGVLFDSFGARWRVLHESWPSQKSAAGAASQRGQQKCIILELQQPVTKLPGSFAPIGVTATFTVEPTNPATGDATIIVVP
jgi:hypothetical protein